MRTIVSITAHNRPNYLEEVIKSWQDVRGIDETHVHFQVEPVDADVIRMCKEADFKNKSVSVNKQKLGALSNPHKALSWGFAVGADFVIVGEDDSVVTPDVLEFFAFAAEQCQDDGSVIAACSFNHKPTGSADAACYRDYFASIIWGTWRNRWSEWMDETWGHTYDQYEWDFRFCRMCDHGQFRCIFPCISRSQHIGQYRGTHHEPSKFERLQAQQVHDGSPVEWRMQ